MTTIIIDEKTKKGKIILELIREIGVGHIVEDDKLIVKKPGAKTMRAIDDAFEGRTIKCTDFDDYLTKVK